MTYSYSFSDGIDGTALLQEYRLIIGSHWEYIHGWTAHIKNEAESEVEICHSPFHCLFLLELSEWK